MEYNLHETRGEKGQAGIEKHERREREEEMKEKIIGCSTTFR